MSDPLTDGDWVPPPRSLLWAKAYHGEEGVGIEIGCDCATVEVWIIADYEQITEPVEIPLTCGGCNSTRWVTIGPSDQLGAIR